MSRNKSIKGRNNYNNRGVKGCNWVRKRKIVKGNYGSKIKNREIELRGEGKGRLYSIVKRND